MPGLRKYGTTEPASGDANPPTDSQNLLRKHFFNSPIYDGSYGHKELIEIANQVMLEYDKSDPDLDFNYTGSPSWDEVKVVTEKFQGRDGYPTTPWTPTQASPGEKSGETNVDPYSLPQYDVSATDISEDFIQGADGTVDPKLTSKDIASTKLGEILIKGKRPTSNT